MVGVSNNLRLLKNFFSTYLSLLFLSTSLYLALAHFRAAVENALHWIRVKPTLLYLHRIENTIWKAKAKSKNQNHKLLDRGRDIEVEETTALCKQSDSENDDRSRSKRDQNQNILSRLVCGICHI